MAGLINKYPGKCCFCGQPVAPYEGTLSRLSGKYVPAHRTCCPDHQNYRAEQHARAEEQRSRS